MTKIVTYQQILELLRYLPRQKEGKNKTKIAYISNRPISINIHNTPLPKTGILEKSSKPPTYSKPGPQPLIAAATEDIDVTMGKPIQHKIRVPMIKTDT